MDLGSSGEGVSTTYEDSVSFRKVQWRCLSVFVVLKMAKRINTITLFLKEVRCVFSMVSMYLKLGYGREKHPLFIGKLGECLWWGVRVENFEMAWVWNQDKKPNLLAKGGSFMFYNYLPSILFYIYHTFGETMMVPTPAEVHLACIPFWQFMLLTYSVCLHISLCFSHLGLYLVS